MEGEGNALGKPLKNGRVGVDAAGIRRIKTFA